MNANGVCVAGPHNSMPDEDLGRIWVGQLPGSGGLYALPASYYEFDFPGGAGDPCPPKGGGGGGAGKAGKGKERDPACAGRSLPASVWDADGRSDTCLLPNFPSYKLL